MSSLVGIGLAFGSAFFKSAKSITTKIAATGTDSYTTSFATRAIGIFIFGFLVIITGQYAIPESNEFWIALSINSILLGVVTILFAKALQISDVSIISPIMALLPAFVAIPAFFILGEVPSTFAGLGLIFVCIGAYTLNINSKDQGYLEPIFKIVTDRGVQLAFIGVLVGATVPSFDKIGIEASNPFLWVLATHIGSSIFIGLLVILIHDDIKEKFQENYRVLITVGFASSMIWVFQSYAYTYTQVAYVQAVKRVSILISVAAGYYIFQEENIKDRFVGAILMLIGVSLIILGS